MFARTTNIFKYFSSLCVLFELRDFYEISKEILVILVKISQQWFTPRFQLPIKMVGMAKKVLSILDNK